MKRRIRSVRRSIMRRRRQRRLHTHSQDTNVRTSVSPTVNERHGDAQVSSPEYFLNDKSQVVGKGVVVKAFLSIGLIVSSFILFKTDALVSDLTKTQLERTLTKEFPFAR